MVPWKDATAQTLEDRVTSLINQMTTDELIKQLHQDGGFNTADNLRLGIPGFIMSDGPHGVRDGLATSFPVGIGMASMWDVDVARRIGVAMGEEFRGKGKHQALGPCLDLDRDPRNGRSPESGGEDPFLDAQTTTAVVKGIQSTPCIATIKHFNLNHRENGRTTNNVTVTKRMLNEFYGLSFRTAVQRGGAMSVMNAYNLINGQKCAENSELLTSILRASWGFPYYVVSDWGSIWNSESAIKAGCDVCMGSDNYQNDLPGLVQSGAVSLDVLKQAVRRVLRTKILAGMLDYLPAGDGSDVNSAAHQQLCLEAGRKSLVLLKNQNNILPLNKYLGQSVALIGPSAAVCQIDGGGSAYVTPFYSVSPKQGLETKLGPSKVNYLKGCDINTNDTSAFGAARTLAQSSDIVIFCGGLDPSQESEGMDRATGSIDLPGKQQDLINALASANSNVIVVLYSGGICGISRCVDNIKGLIYAFYPGQESGNALADVLCGDYNPGGKLPVTMPVTDSQLPVWNDDFTGDLGYGYRWFERQGVTPLYFFGFGLSYTTFSYSNLQVTPTDATIGESVTVTVDVTNTGSRVGEEVAQLYLSTVGGSVAMPPKQLKGFKRIALNPAATTTVTFTLSPDEFYYYNETKGSFDIQAGQYIARVGGSSKSLPVFGMFSLTDGTHKPDLLITNIKMMPPYPQRGEKVVMLATVKNQGIDPVPAGTPVKVSFTVNGQLVSWSDDYLGGIPVGGMALVCANNGPSGNNAWSADTLGAFSVTAVADPDNSLAEMSEENNVLTADRQVYPPAPKNLALRKMVTVSSIEAAGLEGSNLVDGIYTTRWSSQFSDPQMVTIDLGDVYSISDIVLYWEAAYAKEYYLRSSVDGSVWVDEKHQTSGSGSVEKIVSGNRARYIRLLCVQRATVWGYSLYEIEVHEAGATGITPPRPVMVLPNDFSLDANYPNPFNPVTTVMVNIPQTAHVSVVVYNYLGKEMATLMNGTYMAGRYPVVFDASQLSSGVYFSRLYAQGRSWVQKMMMIK
jgi:beta-glucosidase